MLVFLRLALVVACMVAGAVLAALLKCDPGALPGLVVMPLAPPLGAAAGLALGLAALVAEALFRAAIAPLVPRGFGNDGHGLRPIIIDTSAIIDGRVVELYKIGFLRNKIVIAEFVLHELQMISDSQVPLTRAKGRRGLDTLKRLQDVENTDTEVVNADYPDVREVDDKLMRLARDINGVILTTDYNLEQVAKIQKIQCMNLFALVNAVKAPFIPGERLTLQIAKEGSEPNQGIGFLEDGTMIVVANARSLIGQKIEVELVSMIQGASGRMFFADPAENGQQTAQQQADRSHDRAPRGQDRRR